VGCDIKFVDNWYNFYNFIFKEREWIIIFLKYLLQIVEKYTLNRGMMVKEIINALENLKGIL
jgi:hypothetical protein